MCNASFSKAGALIAAAVWYVIPAAFAQTEPPHPILTLATNSGSSANTVLSTWTESQYTNNFTPRLAPRDHESGFGGNVVPGDTDWSWSQNTPHQITSLPSGTVFPNAAYTVQTQAVTVFSGETVNAPYYLRPNGGRSFVFNVIDYQKLRKLQGDLANLTGAYVNTTLGATTRSNYARRIAIALLDWARWNPTYTLTAKNNATFIDTSPSYVLASDLQRASDHNGLAHEWHEDELEAFDAIYDSTALAALSVELGFDVREYIAANLFYYEGDFFRDRVPIEVAITSNLSGPYSMMANVARVLNRPDYIEYMDRYLDATVTKQIRRDGVLSEGVGYSMNYLNENSTAAQNTRAYFYTRPAGTPELVAISNRAVIYNGTFTYGKSQWRSVALPNGVLPSFGDTGMNPYFTARNAGNSAVLPAYGHVSMGAGATAATAVQVNQQFAGNNNHMRADTAAFVLWAFGNQYLDNVGYYNGAIGRDFGEQMLAHNSVTIDRVNATFPDADTTGNANLTLYEPGTNGLAVTEIDGYRAYSNKASRYQRIVLLNSMDLSRPYLVDVFRVTGGTTHDYVLHGAINWDQTWQCSFPLATNTQAYPMLEGAETWNAANNTPHYGNWRNVSSNTAPGNFQVTYLDANRSLGRDTRLWMTADPNVYEVHAGLTPVPDRAGADQTNFFNHLNLRRPSTIVRRRVTTGPLQDLFVSVVEPINGGNGSIQNVERLPVSGGGLEACALRITFADGRMDTYLINLQNPKVTGAGGGAATVSTADGQYSLTGRVGLHSTAAGSAWVVHGSSFQYPGGTFAPGGLSFSGAIAGETRMETGGAYDAFTTTTPLPAGTALRNTYLSVTHGALSAPTNFSELYKIDQVVLTNGLYHVCFTNDHYLEITNGVTSVEQVAPLRTFSGSNTFEIALSAAQLTQAPGTPAGVTAIPANNQVAVSWNPVFGAAGYNVKRSTVNGGPYTTVANVSGATYTDAAVTSGMTHYYVVSAVNAFGESPNSAQAAATPMIPGNLVAKLTFDDGTARDSSGYGNNGALVNGASVINDAQRGNVLSLDGSNDYVDLGNAASLDLSDNNQATITAWVKMAASKVNNALVTKGEWKDSYGLLLNGNAATKDQLWTGNDTGVFSGTAVAVNTWTHVAVVINGDLTTFYLNGQLAGAANQDRGNAIDNTATGVSIGREQYSGSLPAGRWFFNGQLDDVRIYETALSQSAVQGAMSNVVQHAPVFVLEPIAKPGIVAGQAYSGSLAADATDANGDALTFSKTGGPAWLNVAGDGALSGTPLSGDVGANSFTVRVTDPGGWFDETTLNITVSPANTAPVLAAIGNKTVNEGSALTFTAGATDGDTPAQTLTFSLDAGAPAGASINAASGAFTWTPAEGQGPGTYSVTVRVTDNGSPALSDSETVQITVNEVNAAPVLAAIGARSGTTGTEVAFTASASDADQPAQTLAFSLDAGAPAGAGINASSGAFSWVPSSAGTFNVTVRVTDALGGTDFETVPITVTAGDVLNGLVGFWKFDENSGATAADTSGFGNTATLVNSPAWVAPGKLGASALSFTAASLQAASVPHSASLNVTTGITVSVWMNPTDWSGNRRIVQKGNSDNQYRLLAEAGLLKFHLSGVGTLTAALPPASVWTHVAATWNGSTLALYTNGVLQASLAAAGTIATTSDPLSIGRKTATAPAGDYFNGRLDDVRLYNRALSASEIGIAMNGGGTPNNTPPTLAAIGNKTATVGTQLAFTATATDPDAGQALAFSLDAGAPAGAAINATSGAFTWTPAAAGTNNVTVRVTDSAGGTDFETIQIVATSPGSLPASWQTQDIGTVSQAGSASHSGGVYTVSGAGTDIWGASDNFRFVHQALSGDGEIRARISSATGPHSWAKIGVMIRESLNANSANAVMLITPTAANGFSFQRRTSTGGTSTQTLSAPLNAAPNNWVRLVRSGSTVTGYKSADGVAWTQVGSATITMAGNIYIGLAVTAHNSTGLATGVFDNVTVVP